MIPVTSHNKPHPSGQTRAERRKVMPRPAEVGSLGYKGAFTKESRRRNTQETP